MSIDRQPSTDTMSSTHSEPSTDSAQSSIKKFMFNQSFDLPNTKSQQEKEKPKPIYTEEDLTRAREESYAAGFTDGNKVLHDEEIIRIRRLMLNIERHLHQLTMAGMDIWQNQLAEMQEVALVITRKILPAYTKKFGTLEIEEILSKIISEMAHEPRLVIRISPDNFEAIDEKIKEITLQTAYAGKVIVLSDDEFGESDCRVEWADGGIDRDLRTLWFDIDRILEEGTGLDTLTLSQNEVLSTLPEQEAVAAPIEQNEPPLSSEQEEMSAATSEPKDAPLLSDHTNEQGEEDELQQPNPPLIPPDASDSIPDEQETSQDDPTTGDKE